MHPLEIKLAEKKKALEAASERVRQAQKELDVLTAAVLAYTEALEYLPKTPEGKYQARSKSHRGSELSEVWRRIFGALYGWGRAEFGYSDVFETAEELGLEINRDSARTVMMENVNSGLLNRIKSGRFEFAAGADLVLELPSSERSKAQALNLSDQSASEDDLSDLLG